MTLGPTAVGGRSSAAAALAISEVTGATVNAGGRLIVRATKVAADTALAQIAKLRHAPWSIHVVATWSEPAEDERQRAWVDVLRTQLAPWITGRSYLNFADDHPDALRAALGLAQHARQGALKRRYDPTNLLRLDHRLRPARRRRSPQLDMNTGTSTPL